MKTQYDAIVVGAGHNGLICAAYLARSRKKVLVLERRPLVGGSCVTEEVWPGYHVSTTSYVMSMMQRKVVEELELNKYGWKVLPTECLFVPFPDGTHFSLWEDQKRTLAEVAKLSKKDAETYPEFEKFLTEAGAFVRQLFWSTPPNPTSNRLRDLKDLLGIGRKFRKLGGKLYRFTDLLTMSISDFLDMYFESDKLKAVKAYYGSIGTFLGPRSPGTAYVLLHHLMGDLGGAGGWGFMKGGMGAVSEAIAGSARSRGATIRTDAVVDHVLVDKGRARGVRLQSGEEIASPVVVSGADPKTTFLKLVDTAELPADFVQEIRNFRTYSTAFKLNMALKEPPRYTAFDPKALGIKYPTYIHIGPSMAYLEKAYDDAKYGRPSTRPFITPCLPTIVDPDLAPPGKHILNIFGGHAPYTLEGSTWDQERDKFADTVIDTLSEYAPNLRDTVIHRQLLTPPDLERIYFLPHGHIFHGEMSLDQLFFSRPAPGYANYRSPIKGYYQCGSGTHPGGGVMGMGGHNAAREILRDV
jgi:phytoene dehydrogenase-like protein